jgi:hypothetical protein
MAPQAPDRAMRTLLSLIAGASGDSSTHADSDDEDRRQDVNKPAVNLVAEQQEQSMFLQLPREIRDQIHIQALDGLWHVLRCGNFSVILSIDVDSHEGPGTQKGLPLWVATCKQMTTEGIEVMLRTRELLPIHVLGKSTTSVPNALVFKQGQIRHIVVRDHFVTMPTILHDMVSVSKIKIVQSAVDEFLAMLKHGDIRDACLKLSWNRGWHVANHVRQNPYCPEWLPGEPEIYIENWDSWWDGRFRKVTIEVNLYADPDTEGGATTDLVELAKTCAKRLVGYGGDLTVEKFKVTLDAGMGDWSRRIVVERKI